MSSAKAVSKPQMDIQAASLNKHIRILKGRMEKKTSLPPPVLHFNSSLKKMP